MPTQNIIPMAPVAVLLVGFVQRVIIARVLLSKMRARELAPRGKGSGRLFRDIESYLMEVCYRCGD